MQVQFSDGQTEPATITGRDPQTDLAVLKVDNTHKFPVIALGSSSTVKVGEATVVLGAPLGLSGTVTSGIVSALDRTIQVPAENDKTALLVSAVQTDASINPGNSGGAMVNCADQLIGVPTAGATVPSPSGESGGGSIGLGFAIPVDLAKTISDEIIAIITKVNGEAATSNVQLQELTLTKKPGDQVSVEYWRNGHTTSTTVTLGTQP